MFKDLLGTHREPAAWPGRRIKTKNTALEKVEVVLCSCLQNDSVRLYTVSVFVARDKQKTKPVHVLGKNKTNRTHGL